MLTVILGGITFNLLRGALGLRDLLLLRHHAQALTAQQERLMNENAALRQRIARLKADDLFLERLIRQQLGFVRPGDLVYRFPKPEQR